MLKDDYPLTSTPLDYFVVLLRVKSRCLGLCRQTGKIGNHAYLHTCPSAIACAYLVAD
jgi:hypothetical protein